MADAALTRVLKLAGITPYKADLWFPQCRLYRGCILAPDEEIARSITRLWLPVLHEVDASLTVRVEVPTPRLASQYPDVFKSRPARSVKRPYTGKREEVRNGSLF